jgi:hypothetical protein
VSFYYLFVVLKQQLVMLKNIIPKLPQLRAPTRHARHGTVEIAGLFPKVRGRCG